MGRLKMGNKIKLILICGLIVACATGCGLHRLRGASGASYANTCTKTENHGEIDAHEMLNIQKKTTFKADEYINCADGRNLVVVTWEGVHDKTNANLAGQVIARFFSHFHVGENISYLLVPEASAENILVYKFEKYEPQRTIMSF